MLLYDLFPLVNGHRRLANQLCSGPGFIYWWFVIGHYLVSSSMSGYKMGLMETGMIFSRFGVSSSCWLQNSD